MVTPFVYKVGRKKTLARMVFFIFFILATTTLLYRQQMELLTSWRALDRLIWMLCCYLCITIISISVVPRRFLQLSLLIVGIVLLVIFFVQHGGAPWDILLVIGMILTILLLYTSHQRRLRTRAERSSRRYIISGMPGFLGLSALVLSIALISSFSSSKLDCTVFQNNLRRSGIQQHLTQTSIGSLLGLQTPAQLEALDKQDEALVTGTGIMQTVLRRKNRLVDQVIEEQGALQQNICGLIVTQIERLQEKSRRQIAGVLLLYILLRPMLSLIFRIASPFYLLIRKFLFTTGFLRIQWVQKKVMEVEIRE